MRVFLALLILSTKIIVPSSFADDEIFPNEPGPPLAKASPSFVGTQPQVTSVPMEKNNLLSPSRKLNDESTELRRWNQTKDRESYNTRINGYSGRHGGRTSQPLPVPKPLVGPYVEYEFVDRNGDVWEKLGGSDEKLKEYVSEHPEETFADSEGQLYGSIPMGFSISIESNVDNSRTTNESNYNSVVNNSYADGASVSVNIGGTPINFVVNADSLAALALGEVDKKQTAEQDAEKSAGEDAGTQIIINNNISIDGEDSEQGEPALMAQAPESAYMWFLKKVGLKKDSKVVAQEQKQISKNPSKEKPRHTRMLASVSEVPFEVDFSFNWYALAFIVTAAAFAIRELQRSKLKVWIPLPVKRSEEKKSRGRTKPSEGTRATSATRMHSRR